MNQRELLELARATMKKRGGGRGKRGGRARALTRGGGRAAPEEGHAAVAAKDRTTEVTDALDRIAQLDAKLDRIAEVEGAAETIAAAEAQAYSGGMIAKAEATIDAVDEHIETEHEFREFSGAPVATPTGRPRRSVSAGSMREVFRMAMVFGSPKWQEF